MEITTKIGCKVKCIYCPQRKFVMAYKKRSDIYVFSLDAFKACLDKIPITEEIRFSGMGEPCLNPEWPAMLLHAHKKGFAVSMFTTLVGMHFSDIDLISTVPFKNFVVHLPSREKYESIEVDKDYLKVLSKLYKNKIIGEFRCHSKNVHPEVRKILGNHIKYKPLHTRARNIKIKDVSSPVKRRGTICCPWKEGPPYLKTSDFTVLLPNGEVLFCCHDFGIRHVLGNLLLSDYDSLFRSDEFAKIVIGMSDESMNILCRTCENALQVDNF